MPTCNNSKIIALLGLPGSGKTEVIDYLIKKYNWPKVYFGDVTFDEIKKRKLEINEKNERFVREDLRKKYGQLYYAKQVIKKIKKINSKTILVESLYSWDEYLRFKKEFNNCFIAIAIYSSPQTRYNRLKNRPIRPLTPQETQGRDYSQLENLKQGSPIALADFTIINEGTKSELINKINKIIKNYFNETQNSKN